MQLVYGKLSLASFGQESTTPCGWSGTEGVNTDDLGQQGVYEQLVVLAYGSGLDQGVEVVLEVGPLPGVGLVAEDLSAVLSPRGDIPWEARKKSPLIHRQDISIIPEGDGVAVSVEGGAKLTSSQTETMISLPILETSDDTTPGRDCDELSHEVFIGYVLRLSVNL
jgi:hypothetical protein